MNARHEQLASSCGLMNMRLNSTRDSVKVATSLSMGGAGGGEHKDAARQVVVKGLNLKAIPNGMSGPDLKNLLAEDRVVFIDAVKKLMPRLLDAEKMEAGRGLSGTTILGSITKTMRLGRDDARYPPLMINFKTNQDAQLVLSGADEYKETFKERMKEYFKERSRARAQGEDENEVGKPNVM